VFGIRTAEELEYSVVEDHDDVEIRQYAPHLSAQASMKGAYKDIQSGLFRVLAGYIFGKNSTEEDIAMTAPVLMETGTAAERQNEDIAMTAPVMMERSGDDQWTMAFSMPSKYTLKTLPKPLDDRVQIVEIPQRLYAVIRFSGSVSNLEKRQRKAEDLLEWLKKQSRYTVTGPPIFAGYDPPFTLPFLRRNEVLVPIEQSP